MPDELMPVSKNGRTAMDVALEAARAAGNILRDKFHSEHEVHFKGRSDIVTDVDLAAEKTILELLTGEFPDFSILAEESKPVDGNSPYKWVVDPLDGTRNYAHGIPHFCTIIAHRFPIFLINCLLSRLDSSHILAMLTNPCRVRHFEE